MFKKISLILLTIVLMTACVMATACKKDVYTVTFDTDGGTTVAQQRIEEGKKATRPSDPTKVGYEFDDWYWNETETTFDFETTSICKNITLTAKWNINQYSITFDSNGGSAVDTITQDYNTSVTKPTDPTMTGYVFGGWYEEGKENPYTFNKIEARNVSLKARWTIGQFSITFDSNGGSAVDTITQDYNTTVVAPTDPVRIGYTFRGWHEPTSIVQYVFNKIEGRNITLKAIWGINKYSITFDSDGGSAVDTITQDYNTAVVAPTTPTKTGYTFEGWYEEGVNTPYAFNTIEPRNVSLKARWTINQYSISFDSDGGSVVDTITQDYNTAVVAPTVPTKTGYTFVGWYEEGVNTPYAFNTIEPRNVELKAVWTINQYSIAFDSDGGSAVDTITQDYNTAVVAPTTPTKTGYTFVGWFEEGANTPYVFDKIETRNVSLKARWTINQYSISFDSDGGSAVDTITQDYNTSVTKPIDPTKAGYNFLGWFEEGQENAYVFNKIEPRNVSLKARWGEKTKYSITFDSDGGSIVATIIQSEGTVVSAPENPTKEGHTFNGWFEEGQENAYVFEVIETRNVSLKAKWIVNQYSISFDTDGGVPATIDTITQDYGTLVIKPADPTKTGYTFNGWYEDGAEEPYAINTIEARNVSLKAVWTINQYSITFDSDGGSAVDTITQDYATTVVAPTSTKEGHTFEGWYEDGQNIAYVFETIEDRNVSLKARWTINQYSISFDTDGGVPATIDTITQDYATSVVAPADPTKVGFVFLGWIEKGTDDLYEFDTIEARNVELKANWAEIRGTITFDKNLQGVQVNGLPQSTLTPYVGQEILLPELECWGYKFTGWKNLTTGELIEKVDGEYKVVHDGNDVIYQAQWQKTSYDSDIV